MPLKGINTTKLPNFYRLIQALQNHNCTKPESYCRKNYPHKIMQTMEAQNFENRFKKVLEERTLQPSSKSWEQLRSKLDGQETQSKTGYWWLGIAASFVGGAILVSVL